MRKTLIFGLSLVDKCEQSKREIEKLKAELEAFRKKKEAHRTYMRERMREKRK